MSAVQGESPSSTRRGPLLRRALRGLGVTVRAVPFGVWFLGRVIAANWQVARDLLTPGLDTTPGIAAVPLRCRTRAELTLLANLVTLTPGTVTLEIGRRGHVIYVLDIYAPTTSDGLREHIHATETRMLRMLRGTEPPPPPARGAARTSNPSGEGARP